MAWLMGDVGFTGGQLTVLGIVLGPLLTAIGVLFRSLLASKDAHLLSKDDQLRVAALALDEALASNKELAAAVKEATTELRELRQDLWRERRVGAWRENPT